MRPNSWRVDRIQSYLLGESLGGLESSNSVHPLNADRLTQIWIELVSVAICHQANWDRLHNRTVEIATMDAGALSPTSLASMSTQVFRNLFGSAFDERRLRDAERTKLLQDLGQFVMGWTKANGLEWKLDRHVVLGGAGGLYSWLSRMQAFAEDPLRKKARVFVHQLLHFDLIEVSDAMSIEPAIDYHLIRLYLRTGRVLPARAQLLDRLSDGGTERVGFVTSLRAAVEEAMWYTAAGSGLRMDHLNHVEWQIARSFCVRTGARCQGEPLPHKPLDAAVARLVQLAGGCCPFSEGCLGANDAVFREITDPHSVRAFY